VAVALVAGIALAVPASLASAATPSSVKTATRSSNVVKPFAVISGNAHGYEFKSQTRHPNGTVTVTYASATAKNKFSYIGPPGAILHVGSHVFSWSHGKSLSAIGVTLPANTIPEHGEHVASKEPSGTAVSPDATEGSICIDDENESEWGEVDSCDIRDLLGGSAGAYYIADEMESIGYSVKSGYSLVEAGTEMDYPSVDYVIRQEPAGTYKTGCSTVTLSFQLYGVGFSTDWDTCNGTVDPYGLGYDYGGAIWDGSISGTSEIVLEPTLETHTTLKNPTSTFWVDVDGTWTGITT
jgi:hypothetical protein